MGYSFGDTIGGKYCLEEQIGEGGMALVYRAVHMDLDRPVAVKFIRPGHAAVRELLTEKFLREARVRDYSYVRLFCVFLSDGKATRDHPRSAGDWPTI